ncbi:MAG: hypothetical protein ACYC1C_20815 [Chloroflexota bacterium]
MRRAILPTLFWALAIGWFLSLQTASLFEQTAELRPLQWQYLAVSTLAAAFFVGPLAAASFRLAQPWWAWLLGWLLLGVVAAGTAVVCGAYFLAWRAQDPEVIALVGVIFMALFVAVYFFVLSFPFVLVAKYLIRRWLRRTPATSISIPVSAEGDQTVASTQGQGAGTGNDGRWAALGYALYILALAAVAGFGFLALVWLYLYWVTDGGMRMP